MILIGVNEALDAETKIAFVKSIEAIEKTPAGSLIILTFNENDLAFYANARILVAVIVKSLREFILLAATGAKYALAGFTLANAAQKLADRYLYDIKVLAIVPERQIAKIAKRGIDGIFTKEAFDRLTR
ncbi:MAG: hypothetical protein LBI57_08450 [Helicobacteraceae bacterium]|jgi:hypothetical protein|nr:hypothetical protein [Helicobacteraceae bacterium]